MMFFALTIAVVLTSLLLIVLALGLKAAVFRHGVIGLAAGFAIGFTAAFVIGLSHVMGLFIDPLPLVTVHGVAFSGSNLLVALASLAGLIAGAAVGLLKK